MVKNKINGVLEPFKSMANFYGFKKCYDCGQIYYAKFDSCINCGGEIFGDVEMVETELILNDNQVTRCKLMIKEKRTNK